MVKRQIDINILARRHGFTQPEVITLTGLPKSNVSNWFREGEDNRRPVPFKWACVIADNWNFCVYEFYPVNEACKGSTITIKKGDGKSEPNFQYKPAKDWPKR